MKGELRATAKEVIGYVAKDDRDAYEFWRAHAIAFARNYLDDNPEPNPEGETKAAAFRTEMAKTENGKPGDTLADLLVCAKMLNTYIPECFPANEHGQIHFARAMMETTADTICAYVAKVNADKGTT
jgi:hypothetical protein